MKKFLLPLGIILLTFFLLSGSFENASAHKLYLELSSSTQTMVKCHSWFQMGTREACKGAKVKVYKEEKGEWKKLSKFCGKMGEGGNCEFGPVGPGKYKVVVEKIGHKAERIIQIVSVEKGAKEVKEKGMSVWERGSESFPLAYQIISGFFFLLGVAGIAVGIQGYRSRRKTS